MPLLSGSKMIGLVLLHVLVNSFLFLHSAAWCIHVAVIVARLKEKKRLTTALLGGS